MARPPDISDVRSLKSGGKNPREILVEITQIGNTVRVTAIDATSHVEVSFQAPANTSRTAIEHLARSKLDYVMKKGKA